MEVSSNSVSSEECKSEDADMTSKPFVSTQKISQHTPGRTEKSIKTVCSASMVLKIFDGTHFCFIFGGCL